MTSSFLKINVSDALRSHLDVVINRLEYNNEDFLIREISFVKHCYVSGSTVWWRKFLKIGVKIPSDVQIRGWILNHTEPKIWLGYNPRVLRLARERYYRRVEENNNNLFYAQRLKENSLLLETIDVDIKFSHKFNIVKQG